MPTLAQSAANAVAKYQSRTVTATFATPTTPGSLILAVCLAAGTLPSTLTTPSGFTLLASRGLRDVQMSVWYRVASPSITSVAVTSVDAEKSMQLRVLEYTGMSQAVTAWDKGVATSDESDSIFTGSTGTLGQADELVIGFVGNQYASTVQSGFGGGLTRLFESTSPQSYRGENNQDWERSRLTVHQAVTTTTSPWSLSASLSSDRRWLAVLAAFRGGTTGPAKFTSTRKPALVTTTGRGSLTVFGPLRSIAAPPALVTSTGTGSMYPFNYQYRINGFLLSGVETDGPYRVKSADGLYGYGVRTSDDDQPRGDGALRGIDLQSARQVVFDLEIPGTPEEIELRLAELYRAIVPRRDTDGELVWRHPGQPAKLLRCRPTDLPRTVDQPSTIVAGQQFAVRAADPRHYSARAKRVTIPVTPAGADPLMVNVTNEGNTAAYPVITITGPTTGPAVSHIELVNATSLVSFDVQTTLATGSVLVGDMDARITGAPRSVVTLDGQSKYGSWQLPREPFRIDADPTGQLGFNQIYLQTTPAGASVTCTLDYRDTWAG